MKNLIRCKEEQIQKQEAETARKTHEIASLEQSFTQRLIDSTSDICAPAIHTQIQFVNECCASAARLFEIVIFTQTNSREQRCSTVFINYIVLLVIRSCLRKSRIANFTVMNLRATLKSGNRKSESETGIRETESTNQGKQVLQICENYFA